MILKNIGNFFCFVLLESNIFTFLIFAGREFPVFQSFAMKGTYVDIGSMVPGAAQQPFANYAAHCETFEERVS